MIKNNKTLIINKNMDFLFKPASPFQLFGYFDFLVLVIILGFNILILKYQFLKSPSSFFKIIVFVSLFIIIPVFTRSFEKYIISTTFINEEFSNYLDLRFLIWWLIGYLEIYFLESLHVNKLRRVVLILFYCISIPIYTYRYIYYTYVNLEFDYWDFGYCNTICFVIYFLLLALTEKQNMIKNYKN